jgi:hypothetical protein
MAIKKYNVNKYNTLSAKDNLALKGFDYRRFADFKID